MTWLLQPNIFSTEGYKFSKIKKKTSLGHTKQRIEKDNDQLMPPKIFLVQKCLSSQLLYNPKYKNTDRMTIISNMNST